MMRKTLLASVFLVCVGLSHAGQKDCANCQGRGPAIQTSYLRPIEEGREDSSRVVDRSLSSSPNGNKESASAPANRGPSLTPPESPEADR